MGPAGRHDPDRHLRRLRRSSASSATWPSSGLLLALVDYAFQRHRHTKSLKMTKQEVKEENRQSEGDPSLKRRDAAQAVRRQPRPHDGRGRRRRRDHHQPHPLRRGPALPGRPRPSRPGSWPRGPTRWPSASGRRRPEHGVPIVEDRPLAQAVYAACEIDDDDPRGALHGRRPRAGLRLHAARAW